jgi:hypothetical protein
VAKFLRRYWFLFVVFAAVAANWAVTDQGVRTASESAIEGCVRQVERSALEARGWLLAAEARRQDNDLAVAGRYEALANGIIALIPAPRGYENNHGALIQVERVREVSRSFYRFTSLARALHRRGCEEAYGPA